MAKGANQSSAHPTRTRVAGALLAGVTTLLVSACNLAPPLKVPEVPTGDAYKEVGSGGLDFPAILTAAKQTSVRHFFVEQDETPGDPIASLRKSFQYLSGRLAS